jgi:hypothetical protein
MQVKGLECATFIGLSTTNQMSSPIATPLEGWHASNPKVAASGSAPPSWVRGGGEPPLATSGGGLLATHSPKEGGYRHC